MERLFQNNDGVSRARNRAISYESGLEPNQRKRLGQFFTGVPLARLLASLSVCDNISSVIDPMAGHGDLLEAVVERCLLEGIVLRRVDGIEIDSATARECQCRLEAWIGMSNEVTFAIHPNNAFDPDVIRSLPVEGYDLVITNPPYVRYQTVSNSGRADKRATTGEGIRKGLLEVVSERMSYTEQKVWRELIQGYSGLSDLAVPSWLLAAMLVKPGGTLAMVAPATWRNRDYADILQYLLARCFRLTAVVADRQPGWFSEALVRTNLVVATRLQADSLLTPIRMRPTNNEMVIWSEIDAIAAKSGSLVGAIFDGEDPEGQFAEWLINIDPERPPLREGITVTVQSIDNESSTALAFSRTASWLKRLEPENDDIPLFRLTNDSSTQRVPHQLRHIVTSTNNLNLHDLTDLGVHVGQGLRTGCNGFFYVELVKQLDERRSLIRTGDLLGSQEVAVPSDTLKPVLRRQSELSDFTRGVIPPSRVLDLRGYVLPEDFREIQEFSVLHKTAEIELPRKMPDELARLVRQAAVTWYGSLAEKKRIPDLSAVKTNVRPAASGSQPRLPRFWYMLPDFAPRHLPDGFVPRINQGTPWVVQNRRPPIVIDANFSTLWADSGALTSLGIIGIMNSSWVRACMESIGTPMGGGALKLEATHLRRLVVPKLSEGDFTRVAELANEIRREQPVTPSALDEIDRIVIRAIVRPGNEEHPIDTMIFKLRETMARLCKLRQRR